MMLLMWPSSAVWYCWKWSVYCMLVLFKVNLWRKVIKIYYHLQIIIIIIIIIIILFKWNGNFSCIFCWILYVFVIPLLAIIFSVLCQVDCEAEFCSVTHFSINVLASSVWWCSNGMTKKCFKKIKINEHVKFGCCVCVV